MQRHEISRRIISAGILLAGLAVLTTGEAGAAQKKREPQKLSNAQLHEALHVLQATKLTLEKADHDYGGHRASAIKAITAAQKQLREALASVHGKQGKKNSTGKNNPTRGKGKESQHLSNSQLGHAIGVLRKTVAVLNHADHDYGGHRANAVRDLNHAIRQLEMALKFEHRK